jgi:hypothetical protein
MVLLLLGLALVLATSSSLLASSGSGREDEDQDNSRSSSMPQLRGEIAGSVSITSDGEVWLTVFIDEFSVLAQLEVIDILNEEGFRLSIVALAAQDGEFGAVSEHIMPLTAKEKRVIEFKTQLEAIENINQLFDDLGIPISKESIKSIPYAVSCGWKTPAKCREIVEQILDGRNR